MPLVPVAGLGRPSRPGEGQCLPELAPVAMKADRRSPRAMRWGPEIRDEGIAILLVEQNSSLALGMSDRAYVIDDGHIVHASRAADLEANTALKHRLLAV